MKKYLAACILIALTGTFLLHSWFHYSYTVSGYHLLLIALLLGVVCLFNFVFISIPQSSMRKVLTHLFNFTFLLLLVVFYLVILGSNSFWGKAMTANLFLNYAFSFDRFAGILPVQKWILYIAIILLIILVLVLYYFVRPRPDQLHHSWTRLRSKPYLLKRILPAAGISIITIAIFSAPLLRFKRQAHFAGEPAMEFIYGPMWNSETMELVYDESRLQNKYHDQACIDSVRAEPGPDTGRTVVLILLDGLRGDYLPAYGYPRKTTPFLDSLSATGKLMKVQHAFSTSTTTLVGVAGLFDSKDWEHFSFAGLNLMKFIKRKGFSTYAFLTGYHRNWYGLSTIYKNDCDYFYESTENPSEQNFDDLKTLHEFERSTLKKNSFVYVHLLSTHIIGEKDAAFRKFLPDKMGFNTDKRTALVNNYDNGILQADHVISGIFQKLKKDGLLERSTVYILADHGELFGEDGRWSHSGSIQQNILQIPMLIYDADTAFYRNREAASLMDVAPTIADRLGYVIPGCWQGRSLHEAPHDFSLYVNSGMSCEFPQGMLYRKDSIYELQIMDEHKKIKKKLTLSSGSGNWKTVPVQ
jgi:glucan phosphoethanolaminetransferase (alkaline phosphatase superfamily)